MKAKHIWRIAGAVVLAAVIGGCIYLNTLMPIITGYAAKNLASAVFAATARILNDAEDSSFEYLNAPI